MAATEKEVLTYTTGSVWYAGIDGLRALAVLAVIGEHWCFALFREMSPLMRPGRIGVQLFFVISGFLITGIVLDARNKAALMQSSKTQVLTAFMLRRVLRIFPLYYAVILIASAVGVQEIADWLIWNLSYTSNIRDAIYGPLESYQHFWSLCVEEQFYIVWPILILATPARFTLRLIVLALASYPLYVLCLYSFSASDYLNATPFGSMHTLAGGGLLAYWFRNEDYRRICAASCFWIFSITGPAYLVLVLACYRTGLAIHLAHNLLMALALVSLVGWVAALQEGCGKLFFTMPVLQFLGRISYGLYLLHPFVPPMIRYVFATFALNTAQSLGRWQLPIFLLLTVVLAWVSWLFVESPINRLKKHFPYTPTTRCGFTVK